MHYLSLCIHYEHDVRYRCKEGGGSTCTLTLSVVIERRKRKWSSPVAVAAVLVVLSLQIWMRLEETLPLVVVASLKIVATLQAKILTIK